MSGIKYGLIFDVDGVVADTEGVNAQETARVFDELFGVKGVQRADFEKGLGRGDKVYVQVAAAIHGVELSEEQVAAAVKLREEKIMQSLRVAPLGAFEGVLELMAAARADSRWALAIATSGANEKAKLILGSAGVDLSDMVYVTGSDVKNRKPDPEIYLKAVAKLGLKAENCVAVEDAPDGVDSAKAAGCRVIAVTNSVGREKLAKADLIVDSLLELNIAKLTELVI